MRTFSRVRLDLDEAELLRELLNEAKRKRVGERIEARSSGDVDSFDAKTWELKTIKRMIEEAERAMEDLRDA